MSKPLNHRLRPTRYRRVVLNLEELEIRDVPSSAVAESTLDHSQFATDHVIVRWLNDTPQASAYSSGFEALGNNTFTVKLAAEVTVSQAVAYYSQLAGVDFAQPDYVIKTARTANDNFVASQWALNAIHAPAAWNYTTGSKSIIVAVVDTGIDYRASDLSANIWTNPREIPGNLNDDDGNGFADDVHGYDFANNDADPVDDNGHGTHVAGIIGAVGNNGLGVSGVNWNVQIMPIKFMSANGQGYLSNAVKAVNYAVRMGAKIINNSWSGGGYDSAMASAIANAQNHGVIFVAAAGNSGTNNDVAPQYPANYGYSNVVSVAATDQNNNLATFSNYGAATVDIAAPGVSILSTTPNNTYSYYSGTSMASPYVAGAMALVWSMRPEWTYSQVIADVLSTANRTATLNGKVQTGVLDLGKAISAAIPAQPVTPAPSVTSGAFAGTGNSFSSAKITFSAAINPATFTAADVYLTGPAGQQIAVSSVTAIAGTNNTQFNVNFAPQTQVGIYQMSVGPDIRDASNRQLDQNRNGVSGEATDRFALSGSIGGSAVFSSGNVNQTIPDLQTVTSTITIGQHVNIGALTVNLNLTHTYDSDLIIKLVSPTGKEVTLFNRRGGSADNMTNTTFSDSATTLISAGKAPFTGSFRPESALSAFQNSDAYGTWKLVITDSARYDVGKLVNWSIAISTNTSISKASVEGTAASLAGNVVADKTGQNSSLGENRDRLPGWAYQHNNDTTTVVNEVRSAARRESANLATPGSTPIQGQVDSFNVNETMSDAEPDEIEQALSALFVRI